MRTLIQLLDLITSDPVTLAAAGALALALLALLVLIAWPARVAPMSSVSRNGRSLEARALAATGTPAGEIARRTGLSRDALALLAGATTATARQKAPPAARPSLGQRLRRVFGLSPVQRQVTV